MVNGASHRHFALLTLLVTCVSASTQNIAFNSQPRMLGITLNSKYSMLASAFTASQFVRDEKDAISSPDASSGNVNCRFVKHFAGSDLMANLNGGSVRDLFRFRLKDAFATTCCRLPFPAECSVKTIGKNLSLIADSLVLSSQLIHKVQQLRADATSLVFDLDAGKAFDEVIYRVIRHACAVCFVD